MEFLNLMHGVTQFDHHVKDSIFFLNWAHKALINGILVSAPQVVPPRMREGGMPLSLLMT